MIDTYRENFRYLIKSRRIALDASKKALSNGICGPKFYEHYENGKKNINKNTQDILMGRLGIGSDSFNYLLGIEDYTNWQKRMQILYMIIKGDTKSGMEAIEDFSKIYDEEPLDRQFYYRMQAMILQLDGGKRDDIFNLLQKAKNITMRHVTTDNLEENLLSVQEVDTLLDYFYYCENTEADIFKRIICYISQDRYDNCAKSKTLPKAVLYYYHAEKKTDYETLNYILDASTKALSALRENSYSLYLWDILELRNILFSKLMISGPEVDENKQWFDSLTWVYGEFHKDPVTKCSAVVYCVRKVECVNDIIKNRREMLSMSQAELAQKTCIDIRTIRNIELRRSTPQRATACELMSALNMPLVYTEYLLDINSIEDKNDINRLTRIINNERYKEAEEIFERLQSKLTGSGKYNELELIRTRLLIEKKEGSISENLYLKKLKEILERSFPMNAFFFKKCIHITENELVGICNYLTTLADDSEEKRLGMIAIKNKYDSLINTYQEINLSTQLRFVLTKIQSYSGNIGDYDTSELYCRWLAHICFNGCTIRQLDALIYGLWWNQMDKTGIASNNYILYHCKNLASLLHNERDFKFYSNAIKKLVK